MSSSKTGRTRMRPAMMMRSWSIAVKSAGWPCLHIKTALCSRNAVTSVLCVSAVTSLRCVYTLESTRTRG